MACTSNVTARRSWPAGLGAAFPGDSGTIFISRETPERLDDPMRRRLLIIASDVGLRKALARWLAPAGYAIELAEGAKKAREVLAAGEVAASILRVERLDV